MHGVAFFKGLRRPAVVLAAALMAVGLLVGGLFGVAGLVSATPQSGDVAMIGSPSNINDTPLITAGGAFDTFNFTNLAPTDVDADALSDFDTVVLNVASEEMNCSTDALSAGAKTDLVSFVQAGGKLIIYDTECETVDYSWLPFPFTTNNPGQLGANGTLTIAECNTLACSDPQDPHYIDAAKLGSETDAVGDMNVMITRDSHWCLNMEGTNASPVTGAVHAYAHYGSGLIIYNGLDIDYMGDEPAPPSPNGLSKIWLQELQQPFNPDGLACGTTVVTPAPGTHKRSTRTPTPEPTATPAPPTATPLPPPPPPPPPTATPSGGVGPQIVAPATGEGAETGAGLPWTIIGLATAGVVGVVAGLGGYWLWSNRATDR